MIIAVASVPAMVLLGLGATWWAGGEPNRPPPTTTTTTTAPPPIGPVDPAYQPLCDLLARAAGRIEPSSSAAGMVGLIERTDFTPYIAAAPPERRATLETIRDEQDDLRAAIGPDGKVDIDKMPPELASAIADLSSLIYTTCGIRGG